jgi:ketosteroid isomerase-like protein
MDAIVAVAERRALALVERDWDTVEAQLHRAFLYVNANGHRLARDAYLAFLAEGPLRWQAQTLEDVAVAVDGQVAVLVAMVVDEVLYDGQPARWEFVTTQTYVERDGEWLYLAGHTALPAS